MSKAYSPTYCTSGFVLKSKLLHKSEAQHGFLQKLSHHSGENLRPSGSKTKLVHSGVHSGTDPIVQLVFQWSEANGVFAFSWLESRSDGWWGRMVLSGCLHTRKSILQQHQRRSLNLEKGF